MLCSRRQRKDGMGLLSIGFHGQTVYDHLNFHITVLFFGLLLVVNEIQTVSSV